MENSLSEKLEASRQARLVIIIVAVYFPTRHARHYSYIKVENVASEIEWNAPAEPRSKNCSYENLILNNVDIDIRSIYDYRGEHKPKGCAPLIKTALIVPYRNRATHLEIFLNYMHHFLQNQRIHYQIFIVDQNDTLPFNRAKMLNYGAKVAIEMDYSCLILHDVDLIPINTGNIYGCSKMPRHMSSSLDTFRYNLPYLTLFGGAVAILSSQYKRVNDV
ncbi:unnamed protein product [Callosobruchus maculatus]|uniref:Galactosyltransferase N-terminal domain-containing protein n=1 Tax=Callosobruchus maculatus TaxID=64391 RepID=A0A653BFT5_CALMS|nr:unnamed protein product [Callosobruchus maculatus]